jgi:predicted homoserine dehydrogenase-like protein
LFSKIAPYRNPTTQKGFAEKWGQNPAMVTSFADGSKISFEEAIVANATGFVVRSRGMSRGMVDKDDVMKIGSIYDGAWTRSELGRVSSEGLDCYVIVTALRTNLEYILFPRVPPSRVSK